jgi:hypothetical protein
MSLLPTSPPPRGQSGIPGKCAPQFGNLCHSPYRASFWIICRSHVEPRQTLFLKMLGFYPTVSQRDPHVGHLTFLFRGSSWMHKEWRPCVMVELVWDLYVEASFLETLFNPLRPSGNHLNNLL